MHTMFDGKPVMAAFIKVAIVAFVTMSVINLYYSIKLNRKLLDKE